MQTLWVAYTREQIGSGTFSWCQKLAKRCLLKPSKPSTASLGPGYLRDHLLSYELVQMLRFLGEAFFRIPLSAETPCDGYVRGLSPIYPPDCEAHSFQSCEQFSLLLLLGRV